MINKEQKFRLGVFLVVSTVLLAGILAIFIVPKLQEKGDRYFIHFKGTSVNGINEGAAVKYQGVKIGKVTGMEVNPKDLDSITITVRIKKDFSVKKDMHAALQYAGITGLRFIEISGGNADSVFVLPEGEIATKKGLGEKAEDIVLNVDSVVDAVNKMLNAENREKFASMLKNLETSTRVIANTLEKREKQFGNSLEKMDTVLARLVELSGNLNTFTGYLNEETGKVSIANLVKESEELIRTVSKRFSREEMGAVLGRVDSFLETAGSSIRKIEDRFHSMEGEFSKTLVSLRESMDNLARFTRELTEDPTVLLRKRAEKKRSRK
ncbi:MAG: MCE family protein [bacterium]|nr:MCE family protein [bacterium]